MSQTNGVFQSFWSLWNLIVSGGFTMIPLLICSVIVWGVIFERLWSFRKLDEKLKCFHLEAINALLTENRTAISQLCRQNETLPTASLLITAMERLSIPDLKLRSHWWETVERRRLVMNQELRRNLWLLGTIGSAAPFIGLFGTVIGILRSFQEMAKTGSGGFAVVAGGISESLIATAAGIVVAVVAVMAFNAFQTRWSHLVLMIQLQVEEFGEILQDSQSIVHGHDSSYERNIHGSEIRCE